MRARARVALGVSVVVGIACLGIGTYLIGPPSIPQGCGRLNAGPHCGDGAAEAGEVGVASLLAGFALIVGSLVGLVIHSFRETRRRGQGRSADGTIQFHAEAKP